MDFSYTTPCNPYLSTNLPSLQLTYSTWKWMVGICWNTIVFFWDGLLAFFQVLLLSVSGSVFLSSSCVSPNMGFPTCLQLQQSFQGNDDMPFACRKLNLMDVLVLFCQENLLRKALLRETSPARSIINNAMFCNVAKQIQNIYNIYIHITSHADTQLHTNQKKKRNQQSLRILWCKRPSQPSLGLIWL